MDPKKSIQHYGIGYNNHIVYANVPEYILTSKGLVKLMKVAGYWEYNEQILVGLDLRGKFNELLLAYGNKKNLAMTKCLKTYLEINFPS